MKRRKIIKADLFEEGHTQRYYIWSYVLYKVLWCTNATYKLKIVMVYVYVTHQIVFQLLSQKHEYSTIITIQSHNIYFCPIKRFVSLGLARESGGCIWA